MAVRGLGCPIRFTLTAGQKGDAPQADALVENLPADIVMADAAYDSDRLRKAIDAKGAQAVIPSRRSIMLACSADTRFKTKSPSRRAATVRMKNRLLLGDVGRLKPLGHQRWTKDHRRRGQRHRQAELHRE